MRQLLAYYLLWVAAFFAVMGGLSLQRRYVDMRAEAAEAALDLGTWHQYCTQLLTEKGHWATASSWACNNTPLTEADARRVLED